MSPGKRRLNPGYQVSFLIPKSESPRLDGQLLECRTQKRSFAQRDFLVSPKSKSRKFKNAFNFTRFQLLLVTLDKKNGDISRCEVAEFQFPMPFSELTLSFKLSFSLYFNSYVSNKQISQRQEQLLFHVMYVSMSQDILQSY
ncbi:hypothetical protein CEXT_546301 [Caerostris extrusa]|uniref:Uncharacterized protein n=1 Tax=Caerostris extrusa TaxID=172846 RepID=A0AAV4TWH5_CAEEX|nr:hypothetical protein CEXT_546301 [Caerostris extrusa]